MANSDLGKAYRDAAPYIGMGLQIAASFVLFTWLGNWADVRFQTSPLFLIVGLAAAMTAMMTLALRANKTANAQTKKATEKSAAPSVSQSPAPPKL